MDGEKYRQILIHHMSPYVKELEEKTGQKIIFQQDNDPKHACGKVKRYLTNKGLEVLDWISQSPDINPIENGWRQLKQRIAKRQRKAKNLDEVFEMAKAEWNSITLESFRTLIESMPSRCQAVSMPKGAIPIIKIPKTLCT